MKIADAACREPQHTTRSRIDRPFGANELRPRDFQRATHVDTVAATRGGDESSIALPPYALHDHTNRTLDGAVARVRALGDRRQPTPEAGSASALNVDGSLHAPGARSRRMSAPSPQSFSSIRS